MAGNVDGLAAGAYQYDAERHALTLVADGDHRDRVARTTLADHDWLRHAAALLLSGDMHTATRHFADQPPQGSRGRRYVWLEAGHASQTTGSSASPARSYRPAPSGAAGRRPSRTARRHFGHAYGGKRPGDVYVLVITDQWGKWG
ncbi:hypothetical protein [Streptomyces vastus]|uniref:hypothetical protein n=1 Tax=Streptomyces vastus TaxID=285451 RepID=UPI0031D191C8